jgi:hypothetical protein
MHDYGVHAKEINPIISYTNLILPFINPIFRLHANLSLGSEAARTRFKCP